MLPVELQLEVKVTFLLALDKRAFADRAYCLPGAQARALGNTLGKRRCEILVYRLKTGSVAYADLGAHHRVIPNFCDRAVSTAQHRISE